MKILKLGVIGCGLAYERLHLPALKKLKDYYEVASLCDIDLNRVEEMAKKTKIKTDHIYRDYQEMINKENLDLILVCVPIPEQERIYEELIHINIPFIAEKPFATTYDTAKRLRDLSKKNNTEILVAENYRFSEDTLLLKKIIDEKKIGDILYVLNVKADNFIVDKTKDTFASTKWRQYPTYPGGSYLDGGVHDIARLHYLFGSVNEMITFAKDESDEHVPYRLITSKILFDQGVTAEYTYYSNESALIDPPIGFRMFGTKGQAYLKDSDSGKIILTNYNEEKEVLTYKTKKGYYNELVHFYEVLVNNKQNECSPDVEIEDIKIIETALNKNW